MRGRRRRWGRRGESIDGKERFLYTDECLAIWGGVLGAASESLGGNSGQIGCFAGHPRDFT